MNLGFAASSAGSPTPTPTPTPIGPSPGGGGGGFYEFRDSRDKRKKTRELKTLLDESLPEIYAELMEGPKPVVSAARTIAQPFKERDGIDWTALERNVGAVGKLLALVAKQRTAKRQAERREYLARTDEDWFLMN